MNSFTNTLYSKLLSLATLLNFCINSFIVLPLCSTLLSLVTFANLLFSFSNSIFKSAKKSSTDIYSTFPPSKSFITFSFQISTDSLCTYNKTHYIYFSTNDFLIFIHIYSLQAVNNAYIFLAFLLNVYSLATFIFNSVLNLDAASATPIAAICTCSTTNCSCNTATWFISMYNGNGVNGNDNSDNNGSGGSVGR